MLWAVGCASHTTNAPISSGRDVRLLGCFLGGTCLPHRLNSGIRLLARREAVNGERRATDQDFAGWMRKSSRSLSELGRRILEMLPRSN
jgi:hypothetical protein